MTINLNLYVVILTMEHLIVKLTHGHGTKLSSCFVAVWRIAIKARVARGKRPYQHAQWANERQRERERESERIEHTGARTRVMEKRGAAQG
uniref:Uncharacterized protein n=1 Tax=Anopheles atroparvus TaxID=41427 RepID=A0AAG5DSX8_ANOAO